VADRARKRITPKVRLEVLQRDDYKCVTCGRSPATSPGLVLEVDHVEPHSKGGTDELANYQTLCRECNRGKGNDETLNKARGADIRAVLDRINPEIRPLVESEQEVSVVANQEDYAVLSHYNELHVPPLYALTPTDNAIHGFGAMRGLGLYAVNDAGGTKIHFHIQRLTPSA
jgi:hypothetical protein